MNETIDNDGYVTIELTLDNDEVIQCAILTVFEANEKEYIALVPLDDNMEFDADSDIYLYRYSEDEDGEPELGNIEDDDEYEAAADAFDEWMDTLELEDSIEE